MKMKYARCAGLDVHQKNVVACMRLAEGESVTRTVRTFKTTTKGLLELADFLEAAQCTHVGLEATGVYWKPVWHVLEGHVELVLANAQHIKNVPGRKSDVNDATWIAELMAHGLLHASFVPPEPIAELRGLTRTRKQLVREQSQHVQRVHKVLEDANIKLGTVLSEITGVSGRAILGAMIKGEKDPARLAALASPRVEATTEELIEALQGRLTRSHRVLLGVHLGQYDALQKAIDQLETELTEQLRPFRRAYDHLLTIPGVKDTVAQVLIAEVGVEMSRFPTAGHLLSWAGLCPGLHESAGKKKSSRLRKGAPWLKAALMQAAWAASKTKGTYLKAQFLRLKARMMPAKKAVVAVAASILRAVYYMLRDDVDYKDLGGDYFDRRKPGQKLQRLVRQIESLGLKVQLDPNASRVLKIAP